MKLHASRLICIFLMLPVISMAQTTIPLYEGAIPGAKQCDTKEYYVKENNREYYSKVIEPTITAYIPDNQAAPTAAVIICPGGGYGRLAYTHEGTDVAERFKAAGIAAFILKYRLPNDECMLNKTTGPLQDAQQAIYLVRKNALQWKIDPTKIGIMGFSAGGHLASTAGTHFNQIVYPNKDNISVRPDFLVLIYPVISLSDSLAHMGSRINLIGKEPTEATIKLYSNEWQVSAETPPTFLVHAADDGAVKVGNSIGFAERLIRLKIPVEMHIYPHGGHGFGMVNKTTKEDWFLNLLDWMRASTWLKD